MTTQAVRPRSSSRLSSPSPLTMRGARLQKHADYQKVYKASRKHFSSNMAYFFCVRASPGRVPDGARVGLTAGKVLGDAVDRNRIKRRMREAVRLHVSILPENVDVILHPRKSVLTAEFERLQGEVKKIFQTIQKRFEAVPEKDSTKEQG